MSWSAGVCCQKALPSGDSWRRQAANGDTTPAATHALLTATATPRLTASEFAESIASSDANASSPSRDSASGPQTLRWSVGLSVATQPLTAASGASQRAAAMDLATSASDTAAVSTDYVNHGQEDGKQTPVCSNLFNVF